MPCHSDGMPPPIILHLPDFLKLKSPFALATAAAFFEAEEAGVLPGQTRMLTKQAAADYCGLLVESLDATCPVVAVKSPHGDFRYDVRELYKWRLSQNHDKDRPE
jgi:hypothetical protein